MNSASLSTSWRAALSVNDISDLEAKLRNVPTQARSRERLLRVLDAADRVLADEGAAAFTTTRIAEAARIPVGSVYRYFPDKQAIIEALALRYWSDFEDLVAGLAEADACNPLERPVAAILEALAAGFRAAPGFRALWYGGLRSEQVREVTRPTRTAIARSVQEILATRWPAAPAADSATAARMVVLAGDGLLREAFRLDPEGDAQLLAESETMLSAYIAARLG
jgi:AcrR family transcriptional regulator